MPEQKQRHWVSTLHTVFVTLFVVFCGLSFWPTSNVTGHGISNLPPENLIRSMEMFRIRLVLENPRFPVADLTETKSWSELRSTLGEYANQLRVMERQRKIEGWTIMIAYLASAFGMAATGIADARRAGRATMLDEWRAAGPGVLYFVLAIVLIGMVAFLCFH